MADGGGGKIRAKVSSKSRKPYSRPQKQSLFSRITSSVKNLLDPIAPDWLSKKSDGSPVDKKESNHGQLQRAAASETSTSSVFQEFTTSGNTTNSNFVNCTDPTAVTSATVSNVPLADGGKNSNKESKPGNATLVQLWSSKSFMSSQQSTMADEKQPQFKPSLLSSPRKRSAIKDANESAFYTGKVQYGGALNVSRTVSYSSPYTIPRATKVQVRSVNDSRLSGVQNSSMKATSSTNNMSSTARKILQTLEKMSTPLSDAKKIPTYMQSPMYMASRRRNVGASLLSTKQSGNKMPPVDSRVRLTPVSLHKSAKIPLDNSLMTHSLLKSAGAGEQSLPLVTDTPKSSHSHHEASDRVQLSQPSAAQHTGGKMKSQRRTAHYSARHEAEAEPEPLKLPDIALQLTKPLPSFNFGRPGSTSTPAVTKPRPSQKKIATSGPQSRAVDSPSFNFASPSSKSLRPSTTPATAAKNPEYQFRPPIETVSEKTTTGTAKQVNFNFAPAATSIKHNALPKKSDSSPIAKATQSVQIGGSVMDILGAKASGSKSGTESSPLLSVAQAKQGSGSLQSLQQVVRSQSDKWECRVCMVKNRKDLDNCAACQAPKPGTSRSLPPLSKLVDSKASKWECEVCMVKNEESKAACVACQSPKPGSEKNNKPAENSVSASDRPSSGPKFNFGVAQPVKKTTENNPFISQIAKSAKKQWECPTCMIKNDDAKDKCVCCETARPGHVPKSGQSAAQSQSAPAKTFASSLLTQGKAGKWECATCLVRNNADQLKCVSCGDVKRGSASSGSQQPASTATFGTSGVTFSFGTSSAQPLASNTKSGKWECSVCLVKNNPNMNKCAACGENKPGTSSTETKQAASSFKFGTGSTTSALYTFGTGSAKPATDDAKAGLQGESDAASEGKSASKSVKTATSSENSFSIKPSSAATGFQLPVSNQTAAKWDCEVCLVRNAPDLTKCCACQSPKPGSSLAQDPPKQTTFRFGNTSAPLFSFGTSQKSATDVTAVSKPGPPAQMPAPSFTFGGDPSTAAAKLPKTTDSGFSFGTVGATANSLAAASNKAKASPANLLPLAAKSNEKLQFGTKLPSSAAASDQQLTPVSAAFSASKTEGVRLFSTNQDSTISSSVTTTAPPPYDPFTTKPKASVSLFGQFSGGADKPKLNSSATTSGFTGTGFQFKAQAKTDSEPSDKLKIVPKQATSLPAGFGPNTEKPSIAGSKSAFSFGASAPIKSKTDDTASAASDSNAASKQNPFGVALTALQTSSTSKQASFQFGASASTSNQSLSSFSSASSQSTTSQIPSFGAAGGGALPSLFGGGVPKSDNPPKQNTFGMANASNPPSLSQSTQAFPFAQKSTSDQTSLPKPFAFEGAKKSSSTGGPVAGTGFSFGQSATASASTGFGFGSGNAQGSASTFQSASGFRFGAPGNPTPSDKPASFNFGGAPQSNSGGFRFGGSATTAPSIFNAGASNVSKPNDGGSMFNIGVGDPNQSNRPTTPQQRPVKRAVRRYKNTR